MSIAEALAKRAAEKTAQEEPTKLVDAYTPPVGSYIALALPMIVMKSGKAVYPTYGYYVAQSEEEEEMLAYYDSLNQGLVELVESPKE